MKKLFIGTSGYSYKHWKDIFYPKNLPQKDWLSFYSNHFNTTEINATFYRHFQKKVFEKWAKNTNKNFIFTIKGPRLITHTKKLKGIKTYLENFLESVSGLGKKLRLILWQFPSSFHNNEENFKRLKEFLLCHAELVSASDHIEAKQAFEFRDESWFDNNLYDLLNKNKCGFVINDTSAFPAKEVVTGDFAYIRFHGPKTLYSSSYSKDELEVWTKKIKKYLKKYDVYCYFNNDAFGHAVQNAKKLKDFFPLDK